jgi:hypothetical protein
VYTSVFGGFEKIWPPVNPDPTHDHFLVTDSEDNAPGWTVAHRSLQDFSSPRLANRRQKMLFHEELVGYDYSVYLDANVRPTTSLQPLFDHFIHSGADLAMYPHYARSTVAAEVHACVVRAKVADQENLRAEMEHYQTSGFPDKSGMWEGSVIFKNHHSERLVPAMKEWWELYSRFESRDQFSLPFVVWKHGLQVANLDEEARGREHYFHRLQHSSSGVLNSTARYLQARSVENALWKSAYTLVSRVAKR